MATQNIVSNTGTVLTVTTDTSQTFVWAKETLTANYTNGGGSPVTLAEGTLLGRISATGLLVPLASAAADGSQFPVGILLGSYTVAAGATQQLTYVIAGDVVEHKVILAGADTLDTVISGRRIRDRIMSDTKGIRLVPTTEMTAL